MFTDKFCNPYKCSTMTWSRKRNSPFLKSFPNPPCWFVSLFSLLLSLMPVSSAWHGTGFLQTISWGSEGKMICWGYECGTPTSRMPWICTMARHFRKCSKFIFRFQHIWFMKIQSQIFYIRLSLCTPKSKFQLENYPGLLEMPLSFFFCHVGILGWRFWFYISEHKWVCCVF